MSIKRYYADKDCCITDAYKDNLIDSGTLSNDGASDTLQTFVLWNETGLETASFLNRQSRILIHFPIENIIQDINSGTIPASAQYQLILSNARHAQTLPKNYILTTTLLNKAFTEGTGLDQYNFSDADSANWISASVGDTWTTPGGDLLSATYFTDQYFDNGTENLNIDISTMVRAVISGTVDNNGFCILFSSSYQIASQSYFNKKFFGRTSEHFYLRPYIETRWNDSIQDDRLNSYTSASLASSDDNLNTIYFYNFIKGRLQNIPVIGTGSVYVGLYTSSSDTGSFVSTFTGGYVTTGTYSCSFYTTLTGTIYDLWFSGSETYYSSIIKLKNFINDSYDEDEEFLINIKNLKKEYLNLEKPRLKLSITRKNWKPNYYLVYQNESNNEILENLYYKIDRISDNLNIVSYGTGTVEYTKLSYGSDGNYFDLDMNLFEPNYMYKIKFLNIVENSKKEFKETFKFKVISTQEEEL